MNLNFYFRISGTFKGYFLGICTVKKGSRVSPSPAGMSLTKLPLGRNNSIMTSLFPTRESLVVTSQMGTGNSRTFFYGVIRSILSNKVYFSICTDLEMKVKNFQNFMLIFMD